MEGIKFHDIPFLDAFILVPKTIASYKIYGGEQSLPIIIVT